MIRSSIEAGFEGRGLSGGENEFQFLIRNLNYWIAVGDPIVGSCKTKTRWIDKEVSILKLSGEITEWPTDVQALFKANKLPNKLPKYRVLSLSAVFIGV